MKMATSKKQKRLTPVESKEDNMKKRKTFLVESCIQYTSKNKRRYPWCNGYSRRKWTRRHETNCISHSTNTLGEGMKLIILPPAMGK